MARSDSSWRASLSGAHRSSSSVNATHGVSTIARPVLRALDTPPACSLRCQRTRSSSIDASTAGVSSDDPSSTMTRRSSTSRWPSTERTVSIISSARLWVGTTTVTSGGRRLHGEGVRIVSGDERGPARYGTAVASRVRTVLRPAMDRARRGWKRVAVALSRSRRSLGEGSDAVALTFDDGPDPRHTPAILEELRRLDALATFFLVGDRAAAHPDLVRRIVADGHAVGSHSGSHPDPWRLSLRSLAREYRRGRTLVEQAAGRPVHLFRPPKGYIDLRGALAIGGARVTSWLWTVDARTGCPT